jgi:methylated-DNA-[protein]-cysteine S-methyltransferase
MTKKGTKQKLTGVYCSPLGDIVLTSDGSALTGLRFAEATNGEPAQDIPPLADACRWLDLYFSGAKPDFIPRLAPQGTPFQQSVWGELLAIPYGHTVSYGYIAQRLRCRSAQAVGGAVGRNPIALIIPCHRVIGSNGQLTGYAYGLDRKQWLLSHETQHIGKP